MISWWNYIDLTPRRTRYRRSRRPNLPRGRKGRFRTPSSLPSCFFSDSQRVIRHTSPSKCRPTHGRQSLNSNSSRANTTFNTDRDIINQMPPPSDIRRLHTEPVQPYGSPELRSTCQRHPRNCKNLPALSASSIKGAAFRWQSTWLPSIYIRL